MSEFTDGTTKFVVTQSLGVLPGTVTAFSGAFKDGYPITFIFRQFLKVSSGLLY